VNEENYNSWLDTQEAKDVFSKIKPYITYIEKLNEEYDEFESSIIREKTLISKGDELNISLKIKNII